MSKLLSKVVANTVIGLMFLSGGVAAAEDISNSRATQVSLPTDLETVALFAQKQQPVDQKELNCLARNIYHESGGEPKQGKIAVGMVTINRAEGDDWPDSICGVVKQKTKISGRTICQFSWFCNKARQRIDEADEAWQQSLDVAKHLLTGGYEQYKAKYGRIMYFHATHVNPRWANVKRVTRIGDHVFYASAKI